MKKFLAIIALTSACGAQAQFSEIMMTNVGQRNHPAGFTYKICEYKSMMNEFRVSIVAEMFCPFMITYNIQTNTWR